MLFLAALCQNCQNCQNWGFRYSLDGRVWEFGSVPPFDSLIPHHTGPATPYTSLERPKLRIDEITGQYGNVDFGGGRSSRIF